jgi:hypothetical protein
MTLTADGRRRTPTFCPADPAGQKRHALRAGEMGRAMRSAGDLRLVPHAGIHLIDTEAAMLGKKLVFKFPAPECRIIAALRQDQKKS